MILQAAAAWVFLLLPLGSLSQCMPPCPVSYFGYQVFRLSHADITAVFNLEAELFDILATRRGAVDVLVPPERREDLVAIIDKHQGLELELIVQDVHQEIEVEKAAQLAAAAAAQQFNKQVQRHRMEWTMYHPLEDMYEWFDYLEGISVMQYFIRHSFLHLIFFD